MSRRDPSLSHRGFGALVRLLPGDVRERHGDEMVALFEAQHRSARRRGRVAAFAFTLRACADLGWRCLTFRVRRAPQRRRPPMTTLGHDLSIALRQLHRNPAFALVTVLTMALAIGANTAIFSVVYGVLLRPLGIERPEELAVATLHRENDRADSTGSSAPYFDALRRQAVGAGGIEGVTSFIYESVTLFEGDRVEEIDNVIVVDPRFFEVMGAGALLGRTLAPADAAVGSRSGAVVISESLWRNRFGGDPDIVGRHLTLDHQPSTVVGVMAANLPLPDPQTQLWMVEEWDPEDSTLIGRLNPLVRLEEGGRLDRSEEHLRAVAGRLGAEHPRYEGYTISLQSFRDALVGDVRPAVLLTAAAAGLILLVACGNVANLLLARAQQRRGEIAIRRAIGASRVQLSSQLLVESLFLALIGGLFGLALAGFLRRGLVALMPDAMPRLADIRIDAPVLLFALVATLATGLVFGLAPVVHGLALDLRDGVERSARSDRQGRGFSGRARPLLVVVQVAMAVVLLVSASLLVRSLLRLHDVDPGFDAAGVGGARIYLDAAAYRDDAEELSYFRQLLERLTARPDVEAAGASSGLPMDPLTIDYDLPYTLPGHASADELEQAFFRIITPGYLETLRIPLLEGRTFDRRDHEESERVAVINETFARRAWPDRSAVGEQFAIYGGRRVLRVVGVVGDVHFGGLAARYKPEFFVPYTQMTYGAMTVVARAADADAAAEAVRSTALEIDPSQPVNSVLVLERLVSGSIATDRFLGTLFGGFATVALLLSLAGIYGVISFWVDQSRRELGVRMALGATRRRILRLVLGRSAGMTGLGVALGIGVSLVAGRYLASFLFEVEPTDPLVLLAVVAALALAALAASLAPAVRATRVPPMSALRLE